MTTEPWWTCNECGRPIYKVGHGRGDVWAEHRKVCAPLAGGMIVQWDQRDLKRARKG